MNKSNDQFYELLLTKYAEVNIISNSKYINAFTKRASLISSVYRKLVAAFSKNTTSAIGFDVLLCEKSIVIIF